MSLLLYSADDHEGLTEVALGVPRRMGLGHEHLLRLTAVLADIVLDDGVPAVEPVLVPETLEDDLGRVALLPCDLMILIQDVVYDSGEGLLLSLSKGWDAAAALIDDSPAALNTPASCAPCPGVGRRSALLPARSSLPPSPPGEPADIRPPCTSVAPSMGSATTLWMVAGGPIYNRRLSAIYPLTLPNISPPLTIPGVCAIGAYAGPEK